MYDREGASELPSTMPAIPTNRSGVMPALTNIEPGFEEEEPVSENLGDSQPDSVRFMDVELQETARQINEEATDACDIRDEEPVQSDAPITTPSDFRDVVDQAEYATRMGMVTIPDLGAVKALSSQKPGEMLADMLEDGEDDLILVTHGRIDRLLALAEDYLDEGFLGHEAVSSRMQGLRARMSSLPPERKVIELVEQHYGYKYRWWESTSALVRLWGQLDCAIQVLSDRKLLKALIDVLGPTIINNPDQTSPEGYSFAKLTENAGELKRKIKEKYPDMSLILDKMIEKRS